jgi:hypothetical protein
MGGRYLVHGSPKQRSIHPGQTHDQALALAQDVLAKVAQTAQSFGVTYCLEPLSADQTPLINTVAQAAAVVQRINNPFFKTMLDTSSAGLVPSWRPCSSRLTAGWWRSSRLIIFPMAPAAPPGQPPTSKACWKTQRP